MILYVDGKNNNCHVVHVFINLIDSVQFFGLQVLFNFVGI